MVNFDKKLNQDRNIIINFIDNSPIKNDFISMLIKDTPPNEGFMWCSQEGGVGKYWTIEQAKALKELSDKVINLGWDSSGYAIMIRNIQSYYKDIYS